jgi:hypothetical protein
MLRFNQTASDGEFEVKEEYREKIKLKDEQSMEKQKGHMMIGSRLRLKERSHALRLSQLFSF